MLTSDGSVAETVLIYSCAGGANVGQLANAAAIKLDQEGLGMVFCLAAIGGQVESLVEKAKEAGATVVIDGCPVQCARLSLQHAGIEPDCHIVVTELDIEKNRNFELCEDEVQKVVEAVKSQCGEAGEGSSDASCSCCSDD